MSTRAGRLSAIALGGAAGTMARYAVGRALPTAALGFPWSTLAVNVAGSFLLGLVVTLTTERWPPTRYVRPFAAIGFCGGFTTWSTCMVETAQRAQHGRVGGAAVYLAVSLAAGALAAVVGMAAGRGRFGLPADRTIPDPDDVDDLYVDPRYPHPGPGDTGGGR